MAIKIKSWFFEITKTATKLGTRFLKDDRPEEQTFRNLLDSTVLKAETEDRAKANNISAELSGLTGHVVLATDAQAKSKEDKKTDRSVVTQPSQLPEVTQDTEVTLQENVDIYTGDILAVEDDVAVTTRSSYKLTVVAGFVTFLNDQFAKITTLLADVATNTGDIATNTTNIAANTAAIDGLSGGTFTGTVPIGSMLPYMGDAAPAQWILLNGDVERDKVTYASLYAIIGDKYGPPADPANFVLWKADFDGSVLGKNDPANSIDPFTQRGSDDAYLTLNQIPPHTHGDGSLNASFGPNGSGAVDEGDYGLIRKSITGEEVTVTAVDSNGSGTEPDLLSTVAGFELDIEGSTGTPIGQGAQEQFSKVQKTFNMNYIIFAGA